MTIKKLDSDYNHWDGNRIMEATYTCGYCGSTVTSNNGMSVEIKRSTSRYNDKPYVVFIGTTCKLPTFIYKDVQVPGFKIRNIVQHVPEDVISVYDEARSSFSVGAYTAVILLCRKLLMHVAVSFGAEAGKSFKFYVDYMADEHYFSPRSKNWVDSIRGFGNEANHEIKVNTKEEAEKMIKFCEMILKSNYEYPAMLESEEDA